MSRKISIGRDLWQIHGGRKFLFQIVPWLVHRRNFLYIGSLASALPDIETFPSLRIGLAEPTDLPLLLKARPGYWSLGQLQERLKRGHVCVVAWLGQEPVNIRWAFTGSVFLPYLSRMLVLAPDEFSFDEVYTEPRYRHRGIDIMTFRFMLASFKGRGYQRYLCLLTSWETHL